MFDAALSLAHSVHSSKGVFAVLLGSGISRSAGIPTGWEVTLDLVKRIAVMDGEDASSDPAAWYRTKYDVEPEYSALLDTLAKSPAERRAILHSLFEPTDDEREQGLKLPTKAHRAIAKLVASGHVRVVITTNFDRLMELALQDEGITPTVISTADAVKGAAPLVHQKCVVVKLHGDYLDDRIKNTEGELSSYDPELDGYLDRILDEFGLIICGWSGDWDIALRAAIERCKSRRYTTYWAAKGKPSERAERLITLRGAQVIDIESADAFFDGLADKVASLEELNTIPPTSVAVAVASLKRYIADPVHRIRFHDLLANETKRVSALNTRSLVQEEKAGQAASIRQLVLQYDANTEVLRALLINAAFWAQQQHYESIKRSLRELAAQGGGGVYRFSQELSFYPAIVAFYAAGIGAMAGNNFKLLDELARLTFRRRGRAFNAIEALAADQAIRKETSKHIDDKQGWYFPLSEHFSRRLFSSDNDDFYDEDTDVDRLEVMLALLSIDQRLGPQDDVTYMPRGRFIARHDHSVANQIFEEVATQHESWPPFAAGLFQGSADRFERVKAVFDRLVPIYASRLW